MAKPKFILLRIVSVVTAVLYLLVFKTIPTVSSVAQFFFHVTFSF